MSKGDEVMIEIGEKDETDGGVAKEDLRWLLLRGVVQAWILPPPGASPPGCDCCLHLRMDLWLMGVVLEQLVSQSSKAESLPSVQPLVSTSVTVAAPAATAAAAAATAACCSCTILVGGSWR